MDSSTNELYGKIANYDKRIRPYEKNRPAGIRVSFHIASFDSVDEQAMDYRLGIFLRMRWRDPRLSWGGPPKTCNSSDPKQAACAKDPACKKCRRKQTMTVHPDVMERIWIPDLFFSNEKQ